ncbi:hypothetical protein BST43_26270, partial [Mycobacteroides saopaulense]
GLGTDRINWNGGRLKQADPQVLTIPLGRPPELDDTFFRAVDAAIARLNGIADFLVLDMAQYAHDGHWGVVELNDACHAGFPPALSPREVFGTLLEH